MFNKIKLFVLFLLVNMITFSDAYTIKNGDTLYSISKKFNTSVDKLKKINNLTSNIIRSGEKILTSKETPSTNNKSETKYHTVKNGDTLYGISVKYNVSIKTLITLNDIKDNNIYIGEKIILSTDDTGVYTVKKGDSLLKIAQTYNTSVEEIKKENHLTSNTLFIGDKLYFKATKIDTNEAPFAYQWPIQYTGVTSPFGYRIHPIKKVQILHTGVDLKASMNTNLYAPEDGKITSAGWMGGYGKIIIIKHSYGYETRHAHLNKIFVKNGDTIKKGQLIGTTGKTGDVTGPHLHYEIRKDGKPLDPTKYRK